MQIMIVQMKVINEYQNSMKYITNACRKVICKQAQFNTLPNSCLHEC